MKLPVSVNQPRWNRDFQPLPVVRVGEIQTDDNAPALACGRAVGSHVSWRDRRRPQMLENVAGSGSGLECSHRHGVLG